jgi:hypothetical protein
MERKVGVSFILYIYSDVSELKMSSLVLFTFSSDDIVSESTDISDKKLL